MEIYEVEQVRAFLSTWMSQEVSKWLVNVLFHLPINGVYWGYNPLTNLLLTSWDILAGFRSAGKGDLGKLGQEILPKIGPKKNTLNYKS